MPHGDRNLLEDLGTVIDSIPYLEKRARPTGSLGYGLAPRVVPPAHLAFLEVNLVSGLRIRGQEVRFLGLVSFYKAFGPSAAGKGAVPFSLLCSYGGDLGEQPVARDYGQREMICAAP